MIELKKSVLYLKRLIKNHSIDVLVLCLVFLLGIILGILLKIENKTFATLASVIAALSALGSFIVALITLTGRKNRLKILHTIGYQKVKGKDTPQDQTVTFIAYNGSNLVFTLSFYGYRKIRNVLDDEQYLFSNPVKNNDGTSFKYEVVEQGKYIKFTVPLTEIENDIGLTDNKENFEVRFSEPSGVAHSEIINYGKLKKEFLSLNSKNI